MNRLIFTSSILLFGIILGICIILISPRAPWMNYIALLPVPGAILALIGFRFQVALIPSLFVIGLLFGGLAGVTMTLGVAYYHL